MSHRLYFEVLNILDRDNAISEHYNPLTQQAEMWTGQGISFYITYRFEFAFRGILDN